MNKNSHSTSPKTKKTPAVVLLSGGLDSATTLYYAQKKGYAVHALVFEYGQRHRREVERAKRIARRAGCPVTVVRIALPWGGSALLDDTIPLPTRKKIDPAKIPSTYVPARNIIFLSMAASFAEAIAARAIYIGANALDYSGYPDCRPGFFTAFRRVLLEGLKTGVDGKTISVEVPLLKKTKAEIIRLGISLGVPYELTWSCYSGGVYPCGSCDSCRLRAQGFARVGIADPALKSLHRKNARTRV